LFRAGRDALKSVRLGNSRAPEDYCQQVARTGYGFTGSSAAMMSASPLQPGERFAHYRIMG
jgi:hypothetical protein